MYNKIVDAISVKAQIKPMGGGKVEQWWRENGLDENRSLNKTTNNRFLSGREKDSVLKPSVMETLQACSFKGFEFGNWLSQAERYDVFRAFQWCLQDMTNWLGTMNLGFDSCIGVAFGARGSRGARAHYEPATNIINMTKQKGAGSFLHEYAHAIDYCVGAFFDQCGKYTALSGGGRTMEQPSDNVGGQFRAMMNKILIYARNTESYNNMLKNPLVKVNIDYWGNSTEMFARLTEAYYAYFHNHRQNHYLVKRKEYYEGSDVYLTEEEIRKIKPEIDKFWKEVALLLNNKCKLKKTPFPVVKIKPKNEKATAATVSQIVQEQAKALKKKKVKSNFKNKYSLLVRVSHGTGSYYTVLMEQKLPGFEFNAHERREFSVMLKEALTKAGIKVTASEVGGNDGRPVYYLIRAKHLHETPADVDMSISFVDANSEEKKDKPKAASSKKKGKGMVQKPIQF